MKRRILIVAGILMLGLIGVYQLNRSFGFVDLSTINVETTDELSVNDVKVVKGFYSINRENDRKELFNGGEGSTLVYNGRQIALLNTDVFD